MYNKKQSLLSTVQQVRDKRPMHMQNARTIFTQMHVDAKAHLMHVIPFVIRFHLWHSSPSSLNKKEDKRQFLQTPLKNFSADKQTADWFLAMHAMVLVYRR